MLCEKNKIGFEEIPSSEIKKDLKSSLIKPECNVIIASKLLLTLAAATCV